MVRFRDRFEPALRKYGLWVGVLTLLGLTAYVGTAPLRQATRDVFRFHAVSMGREIGVAENEFHWQFGRFATLAELGELHWVRPEVLSGAHGSAYAYRVELDPDGKGFLVHALPPRGWVKHPWFSIDELGSLRVNEDGEASRSITPFPPD